MPGGEYREAFLQGLREYGYEEGQSVAIEWRYPDPEDASSDRRLALAEELVALHPAVLVGVSTPGPTALKARTSQVPIVGITMGDPVGVGLAASLARPGGNVTGLSYLSRGTTGKRLRLLKDAVPDAEHVAVLVEPANPANALVEQELQDTAAALGIRLQFVKSRAVRSTEIERAFVGATREGADAFLLLAQAGFNAAAVELTNRHRVPVMGGTAEAVRAGALMAYGPSLAALYHRAAYYVDRILQGTQPADLPIEQPTVFDFVINLQTAQALGLIIPPHVLLQATELIP